MASECKDFTGFLREDLARNAKIVQGADIQTRWRS